MATSKKPTTKSSKASPKKTTARKATPAKKTTAKSSAKTSTKSVKAPQKSESQSFKIVKSDKPFFSFGISMQSTYWIVFGIVVILLASWILKLQSDIDRIYDQIEISNAKMDAEEAVQRAKLNEAAKQ